MTNKLTAERLREVLIYNPDTGGFTWLVSRGRAEVGALAGTIYHNGRRYIVIDGHQYAASRLAVLYMTGNWLKKAMVNHRDLNKSNDAWRNLREATRSQNNANTKPRSKTGVKGVYRSRDKFFSVISIDRKSNYLETFETLAEATIAYEIAAKGTFGEFARILA